MDGCRGEGLRAKLQTEVELRFEFINHVFPKSRKTSGFKLESCLVRFCLWFCDATKVATECAALFGEGRLLIGENFIAPLLFVLCMQRVMSAF